MAPPKYSLRLQKGIIGGFAPPIPTAVIMLERDLDQGTSLNIDSRVREYGSVDLTAAAPKSIPHPDELVNELHSILLELPTEEPPGSEDIYGLDTSIAWGSDDLEWYNGGPQGCGGGVSSVQVSHEQKAKFKRAVEIVEQMVRQAE